MPSAAVSGCELEAGARPLKTVRFAWRAFGLWQLRAPLDFRETLKHLAMCTAGATKGQLSI